MNFYFLFIVFLYAGGSNARVVPLNFKLDTSNNVDSSISENKVIGQSSLDEVEILGHSLPDTKRSNVLELSDSGEKNATVFESPNRNASNLLIDVAPKEDDEDESNSESEEFSVVSDVLDEEFKSVSEFISKMDLDTRDSFGILQVNETLNDKASEDLFFENETLITNISSSDLGQGSNLDFVKIEEKILNDTINENETFRAFMVNNDDRNETSEAFMVNGDERNETLEAFMVHSDERNETLEAFMVHSDERNETLEAFMVHSDERNETLEAFMVHSDERNETLEAFIVNSDGWNETFAASEVNNSDQNETSPIFENVNGTNSNDNLTEFQTLSNGTKVEVFLSGSENITEQFKLEKVADSENSELNDSLKTAGGILSGFEFLINSEVARNAAKAMEVFNFSDPLTDHIMEENEFHSFLPAFNAVQDLESPNQTDLETPIIITRDSGQSNETRIDFNTSLSSTNEASIVLNQAESEEIKENPSKPFNLNEPMEKKNETELSDLVEKFEGSLTSNVSSLVENSEENIQLASETTQNSNASIFPSTFGLPECPPPGWCIFWFLSQDTCAVNEHCHGNRICCKIRCFKTCIEV